MTGYEPHALTCFSKSFHVSLHIESTLSNMPCVTSTKWDRTLVLNIPIFIAIWFGLHTALEVHFHLIIRHQVLGYRLNTYRLEVTGYSDDPWWREFYIDFEFSRLQFRSRPIGPTGDGPLGPDGDNPPPHGDRVDHLLDPVEDRHLLRPGNPHLAAKWTTSTSLSTRTGAPPNLFLLQDTMYLSTLTCWAQTQQLPQAHTQRKSRPTMKQFAQSRRLGVRKSRLQRTARSQMSWMTRTSHHFPWPCDRHQHRHRCQ